METITKQYEVFEFDELTDDVKQKVIEKYYDINVDFSDWYEFVIDDFKEQIKEKYGLDFDKEVYFDIEYRYRHLCFNKIWIDDIKKFIKGFKKDKIAKGDINFSYKIAKALKQEEIIISFENHREHTSINYSDYSKNAITDKYKYLDDLQDWFNDNVVNALLKRLTDEYEYLTSKESIIDTIKANEFKFLSDGERF
jgi:hypothetical protein